MHARLERWVGWGKSPLQPCSGRRSLELCLELLEAYSNAKKVPTSFHSDQCGCFQSSLTRQPSVLYVKYMYVSCSGAGSANAVHRRLKEFAGRIETCTFIPPSPPNMPPRPSHDPFTDAPLRPTTSNANSLAGSTALRHQTSQHSLRSNASTTSSRTRQPRDLFAPGLTRRAHTPRFEDEVLADSDSGQELGGRKQAQARRTRHGSPQGKAGRGKSRHDEEQEFVNRQPDGSYLLGVAGLGDTVAVPQMSFPKTEDELEQEGEGRGSVHAPNARHPLTRAAVEADTHYGAVVRHYFASGASINTKEDKNREEGVSRCQQRG